MQRHCVENSSFLRYYMIAPLSIYIYIEKKHDREMNYFTWYINYHEDVFSPRSIDRHMQAPMVSAHLGKLLTSCFPHL